MYEITIEKTFAAAHALKLPDGSSEPVHEHNWRVSVTVARQRLDGMDTVMDFHDLEAIVGQIIAPLRDRHLNEVRPFVDGQASPSAEKVAWWIGTATARRLPDPVSLVSVTVGEAPGCAAVFRP